MENKKEKVNYNKVSKEKEIKKELETEIKNENAKETIEEQPIKIEPKKNGFVNSSCPLNLRENSRKDSAIVSVMPPNARVQILGEENGFYKVKYNTLEGYAMSKFITVR